MALLHRIRGSILKQRRLPRTTNIAVQQQLLEKICQISSLVRRRIAYVDTIQILVDRDLAREEIKYLNLKDREFGRSQRPGWFYCIIQRPSSSRIIRYIERKFPKHIINRVDIAIDLLADNMQNASTIIQFLEYHVTQPHHGRRLSNRYMVSEEERTQYFGRKWTTRNIALYVRTSKITKSPAAHLELRYCTARSCRKLGVQTISDLRYLDLETLLQHDLLQRDLKISGINWSKADRIIDRIITELMRRHNRRVEERPSTRSKSIFSRPVNRAEALARYVSLLRRSIECEFRPKPTWDERFEFPVQQCLEWITTLRKAVVHISMQKLIPALRLEYFQ
jgi:hypothetical protein